MSRLVAYARLVRLPNVFTACADVSIGLLAGHVAWYPAACLLASSACLYSAGMAWNDLFDRWIDASERPERPIPSGAVSPIAACGLACALSILGLELSALASPLSLIHAAILLVLVLLYNIGGKATPVGPLLMGGCRFLNVLLGFSIVSDSLVDWPLRLSAAGIVGVYIVGVTLFARDEARASRPARLRVAFGICAIAVIGAALVPSRGLSLHPYLCAGLLLLLARPAIASFAAPNPMQVQQFVKQSIFGLVYLDAALAIALAGPYGLFVIFWHLPAVILGRRLYST